VAGIGNRHFAVVGSRYPNDATVAVLDRISQEIADGRAYDLRRRYDLA
jgi:hypothetical protein